MAYTGSVELISGIKQKNNGTFPLVDASAVRVTDNKNLDAELGNFVRYDETQSLTDAQKVTARENIDASSVDDVDELKSVLTQDKDLDFIQLNKSNLYNSPMLLLGDIATTISNEKWHYNTSPISIQPAPNGIGNGVSIESSKRFGYAMPLSSIISGNYYSSIKRDGTSPNGRLLIIVGSLVNNVWTTLNSTQLSGISGDMPEWTFTIDKETIMSTYPTATHIDFVYTNTASGSVVFYNPILCLASTVDKSFYRFNRYYKAQDNLDRLLNSSFVAGNYNEKEIVYRDTQGYYSYNSSSYTELTGVYSSEEIEVSGNIKFSGGTWANVPALIYFDANHDWVGQYPTTKPESQTAYVNASIVLPNNVKYVVVEDVSRLRPGMPTPNLFQSMGYKAKESDVSEKTLYAMNSVLYGKKLVTAGDSYTAADYTGSYAEFNGKNYGYYVAQRNNMDFVNAGISGSIMALSKEYIAGTQEINYKKPFSYQRYLQVPEDTDYLTIWFGINDASHTNLGTIDNETNETFYGAWNVVLNYFLTNYPFMKIGIIITTGANAEYRQAVREVAQKWGYPYLDWVDDVKIPAFFDRNGMSQTAQDLRRDKFGYNEFAAHPNPKWHEYASTIYENFLKSL